MGSKKRSARARRLQEFKAGLGGMDDVFARAERQQEQAEAEHEASARRKACESKTRYASRSEAEEARAWCEKNGSPQLHIYRCPYCNGWHLTSHPWKD